MTRLNACHLVCVLNKSAMHNVHWVGVICQHTTCSLLHGQSYHHFIIMVEWKHYHGGISHLSFYWRVEFPIYVNVNGGIQPPPTYGENVSIFYFNRACNGSLSMKSKNIVNRPPKLHWSVWRNHDPSDPLTFMSSLKRRCIVHTYKLLTQLGSVFPLGFVKIRW
jgi:hypothetical protein